MMGVYLGGCSSGIGMQPRISDDQRIKSGKSVSDRPSSSLVLKWICRYQQTRSGSYSRDVAFLKVVSTGSF